MEQGQHVFLAIITEQDNKTLREKMRNFLIEFEDAYEESLQNDIANISIYKPVKYMVESYFK